MTVRGAPKSYLECEVIPFRGSECLIWPFGKFANGYARIGNGGSRTRMTSTLVCEIVNGKKPIGTEAAHSCGNGNLGCVNPNHLSWKTPKENQADRIVHGTSNRGSRHGRATLTESQVLQIYGLKGSYPYRTIADMFGTNLRRIERIMGRQDWGWLTAPQEVELL